MSGVCLFSHTRPIQKILYHPGIEFGCLALGAAAINALAAKLLKYDPKIGALLGTAPAISHVTICIIKQLQLTFLEKNQVL